MKTSIPKLHSIKFKEGAFAENVVYSAEFPLAEYIPTINVLQGAILQNLRTVVLIGYDQSGHEYVAGSMKNPKEAAYLFGRGQLNMLRRGDGCHDCQTEDGDPAA